MKSFANKLNKLTSQPIRIPPPVLFGQAGGEVLLSRNIALIDISPRIRSELMGMVAVTQQFQLSTLAANQLNYPFRALTLNKQNDEVLLMINPEIVDVAQVYKQTSSMQKFARNWEYSLSLPFMRAKMGRYAKLTVTYQDEFQNDFTVELEGAMAYRVQQSIDQLNGFTLLDCRISQGEWEMLKTKDSMVKTSQALQHHSKDVQKLLDSHPQYFVARDAGQLNKLSRDDIEEFSFEDLMLRRMFRYVQREFTEMQTTQPQDALYEQLKHQK